MTGFLFEPYAAVWRSREDDINAVVCIPVEVRSAPDDEGDVRCFVPALPMLGNVMAHGRIERNHFRLPLAELVLDIA